MKQWIICYKNVHVSIKILNDKNMKIYIEKIKC